ncbi:MAG: GntR family transcriptional regulator [Gemmataceae bacterium]
MLFHVDPKADVAIYEQIENQVIFGIASGTLAVGELIPSVRDLGERLAVHPNTVAKAYQSLEKAGFVEARRGRGMEVTPDAPAMSRRRRQAIVRDRLRDALREAVSSALAVGEIRDLVEQELARADGERNGKR